MLDNLKTEKEASNLDSSGDKKAVDTIESEAVLKNGKNIPIEYSISEFFIGQSHNYILIVRDITERKSAEETLANSEKKYRTLVENTNVVYAFTQ